MRNQNGTSTELSSENAVADLENLVSDDDAVVTAETIETETEPTPAEQESETDVAKPEESESEASTEEQDEDSEENADTGKKLFNEVQQKIFDKRVGKEVAKRKEAVKEAEERAKAAEAKLAELSAKADPDMLKVAETTGIAPEYLTPTEAKTIKEYQEWKNTQAFCQKHLKTGWQHPTDSTKDWSSEDLAEQLAKANEILIDLGPEVRPLMRTKAQQMAEDRALGRKIRLEKIAAAKNKTVVKPPQVAPRAGSMAPAAPRPPVRGMSEERFIKGGRTKEAALRELANLVT
jgi:hypothetical protein